MLGLRTQESRKVESFFKIVQAKAAEQDCIFFCDCGEGREFFMDGIEGEDLMGWLIPNQLAEKFEPEWLTNDVSEKWNSYVRFAIWKMQKDQVTITFEEY